jgi:hypothetical protein
VLGLTGHSHSSEEPPPPEGPDLAKIAGLGLLIEQIYHTRREKSMLVPGTIFFQKPLDKILPVR